MQEFDPITGALITPMNNAAMLAGGSKPMTAMDNPYQTGQANMNPNFIGNYSGPTTGMLAQEKIANLQPQIPMGASIVLDNIKSTTDSAREIAKAEKGLDSMVTQDKKYLAEASPLKPAVADRSDSTAMFMAGTAPGQFGNPGWEAAADSAKKRFPNIDPSKIKGSDILGEKAPISDISEHLPIVNKRYGTEEASKKGIASIELDQSKKIPTIPAQNPGVYKSYDLSKPQPNEFDVKTSSGIRVGSGGDSEVTWRSYANDVANDHTTSGKGISGKALSSLMHLERHGQTSRMNSGPLKSPTEKINDGFKKGYDTYLEKPKVNQDKKMPTGPEGKGIRGLATSVQENMGYDPLSQERLTQSRRGTKCMRVKRK
mgnify:CR=1 FL=1